MLNLVTSKRAYRLIPILIFTCAAALILLAGPAQQTQAEAQAFPPWSFKPVASAVPVDMIDPSVVEIGEQRELLINHFANSVRKIALVIGGAATPILAPGDLAPGGGTFTDVSGLTAYIASPTLIYLTTSVDVNGSIGLRHFRWSNGTLTLLTPAAGVIYDVARNDAHGRFIAKRSVDATHTEYWITDGDLFNSASITLVSEDSNASSHTDQQLIGITATGAFLIHEQISSGTVDCVRRSPITPSPDVPNEETTASRIFWLGSRTGTLASGTYSTAGCGGNGLAIYAPVLNSAGDVLSGESTIAGNSGGFISIVTKLWLYPADDSGAEQVAQGEQMGDVGPYFFLQPKAVTEWRQPIFKAATDPQNGSISLFSGPNPAADRFDGDFVQGFGQDGTPLELYTFSEKGDALVYAHLADNTFTYALAHSASGTIEWVNANGGNWNTAVNWDPVQIPDQNAETLFRLEATYPVTIGTRTSGRSRIENGNVSFRNADLTLIGPLSIGGDAKLTLPEGTLKVSEITLGHLPPISPLTPTLAQLYVSNVGTVITGSTAINIGAASEGELFISDATLVSSQVRIGVNSPGAAIVGGSNANWFMSNLAVGSGYTGTLNMEHGGDVLVNGSVVVGHGPTLQNYLATTVVDGAGTEELTTLVASDTLTIGQNLRGRLDVSGGALVIALQDVGLGAVRHINPPTLPDGELIVSGQSTVGDPAPSIMNISGNLNLGLDWSARSDVIVYAGASLRVGDNFTMSVEPGSESQLLVQGVGRERSRMEVGNLNDADPEYCKIGDRGPARVFIYEGGLLRCPFMFVGGQDFIGVGTVVVDRRGSAISSVLRVDSLLAIGNAPENIERQGRGRLILRDGDVLAGILALFTGSSIEGTGRIGLLAPDGILALEGAVDPGVTIIPAEPPLEPIAPAPLRAGSSAPGVIAAAPSLPIIQPGTLTISNSVTLSPTAVITLDVIGKTANLYDHIIVSGTAKLGGQLVLNFGDGFAPKQGENYNVMQADAFASAFQTTTIAGLAPGFTYTLSATGGAFNLVALNDGVPTTTQAARKVYLPLIKR